MTISQSNAVDRLRLFGLRSTEAVQMVKLVERWVSSSGPEWTVKRLKDVKQALLKYHASDSLKETSTWLKLDDLGRIRKGPFRVFFSGFFSHKRLTRVLNALMIYSSFISPRVTAGQWKKFHSSVNSSPVDLPMDPLIHFTWGLSPWTKNSPIDLEDFQLTTERRTSDGRRSVSEKTIGKWFPWQCKLDILADTLHTGLRLLPAQSTLRAMMWNQFALTGGLKPSHSYVGTIGLIQEAGFKLRAVANPNRIVQILLEPYKRALGLVLKEIPQDCTYDQGKALPTIQRWLSEGRTVSSVDLSDATNLFPMNWTTQVLTDLDYSNSWGESFELFVKASRGLWISPHGDIQWTKGQPLGLGPSFFAFALSHHSVMHTLGITEYFILGDDVVIANLDDAHKYRALLEKLECPVSEGKTITSNKLAEFAGKVITPRGVVSPLKWRQTSDVNFMDQIRNLGPEAVHLLTRDQRRAVKLVGEIPEWMGGLGWNPKGYSLSERIDRNIATIRALEAQHQMPLRQRGYSEEVLSYFLSNGLSLSYGMPHDSEATAVDLDRDRLATADVRLRTLRVTGVIEEKSESVLPGFQPVERSGDPRATPKALLLAKKLKA